MESPVRTEEIATEIVDAAFSVHSTLDPDYSSRYMSSVSRSSFQIAV